MPSYSSIVRTLRIAVPAVGAGLLILFFLWPTITRIRLPHIDKAEIHGDRTELIHPRYEGKEKDGSRYILTADRAIQVRADPDHVTLIAPTAALEKADGTQGSKVAAQSGIYNSKAQFLNLSDHVTVVTPAGDTFATPAAEVNLKTKEVDSTQPVTGDGPRFTLSANGFTYDHTNGLLTFTGPAKLLLHGTNDTNSSAGGSAASTAPGAGAATTPPGAGAK